MWQNKFEIVNVMNFCSKQKNRIMQKVIDIRFNLEYNRFIKSKEWFLAHHIIRRQII